MNKKQIREQLVQLLVSEAMFSNYEIGKDILDDDDLDSYGMDSFAFIKLLVRIEQTFAIEIPNESLVYEKWDTIHNMVESLIEIMEAFEGKRVDN